KRQRLGVGAGRSHVDAQAPSVRGQGGDHAGGDVGARGVADQARLEQVEAEVARPSADLQRALVAAFELGAQQLAQLADHLRLADLAEIYPPLGVVAGCGDVVIARVDVANLIGAPECLHGGRHITLSPCHWTRTFSRTSPPAYPRSSSPASARSPTFRPRTTGSAAISRCTNGSPSGWRAGACSTWPVAKATAPMSSRARRS